MTDGYDPLRDSGIWEFWEVNTHNSWDCRTLKWRGVTIYDPRVLWNVQPGSTSGFEPSGISVIQHFTTYERVPLSWRSRSTSAFRPLGVLDSQLFIALFPYSVEMMNHQQYMETWLWCQRLWSTLAFRASANFHASITMPQFFWIARLSDIDWSVETCPPKSMTLLLIQVFDLSTRSMVMWPSSR